MVDHVFILRGDADKMTEIRNAAGSSAVPITFSNASELDTMSFGSNHQGVAAAVRHTPPADLEDLAHASSADGPPLILATDQVQDVGNLGALLRTLEAVDGAGIVVPSRRSASITGGLARASAGASLRTRIVEVTNVSRALNDLREAGVWLYALDQNGDTDHDAVDFNRPTCLVVGNESHGIRPLVRDTCDEVIRIRMYGSIGSLNVSVAGAIAMHHAISSRGGSNLAGR